MLYNIKKLESLILKDSSFTPDPAPGYLFIYFSACLLAKHCRRFIFMSDVV